MQHAPVTPSGAQIRWIELPAHTARDRDRPPRVYLHGLGASSGPYFAATAVHPAMAGPRSLLLDLLGHGISDRPQDFDYSLESHADAVAAALTAAGVADAEVIGHSLGGAVAIALAHRHPELVSRLVLADAVLDPIQPCRPGPGSSGIASYSEQEFLDGGWREVREAVGPHWWSTMRLADRTALHRSAVHRTRGTLPKPLRALLLELPLPRTFLHPAAETVIGADQLTAAGVNLVPIPDAGHNLMLDAPDAFAAAVAASLS